MSPTSKDTDTRAVAAPVAIIMRGLPGSGKSHWVEQFIQSQSIEQALAIRQRGYFSTDKWFYQKGQYRFQAHKLAEYHQKTLVGFIQALANKEPVVICDNTNLALWEFMAYEIAAKALGYQVRIVLVGDPLDSSHQQLCAERNQHQVPLAQIKKMALNFQPS